MKKCFAVKHERIGRIPNFYGHDTELIVDHCPPGNRPANGNQVVAPLKNKCDVPRGEQADYQRGAA
jgi:hypothetical protein